MGKILIRNPQNTGFVDDFCRHGWKVRDAHNGSWIQMTSANTKMRNASNTGWIDITCPVFGGVGWKINYGIIGPWGYSARSFFKTILAELIPNGQSYTIDQGPNKGSLTNYRWINTTIPYDPYYDPVVGAVYYTGSGYSGFGSGFAVYEGQSGITNTCAAGQTGLVLPYDSSYSSARVIPVQTGNWCQSGATYNGQATWYTSYYDRGGYGPGSLR